MFLQRVEYLYNLSDDRKNMFEKPTIAITGANGFIGKYLVDFFQKRGYKVLALIRHFQEDDNKGALYRYFDLAAPVNDLDLAGCDILIHCAYVKKNNDENSDFINIYGTQSLYGLSKIAGVGKFIFISSLSAHEKAASHYGQVKLKIESMLDDSKDLILKPGLVLGKGGLFGSILKIIRNSRILPLIDGGRQNIQGIDIEDLAECIRVAVDNDITGKYALVADQEFTLINIAQTIANKIKRKIRFVSIPYWLANFVLSFFDVVHLSLPVNKENLLGLRQNVIWSGGDCARVFGVRPKSYIYSIDRLLS